MLKPIRKIFQLPVLLIIIISAKLDGQLIKTKLDIVAGASAREFFHTGIRYLYAEKAQLGIYYGGDVGLNTSIINTYAIDNMFHFGRNSYKTNRPPWYTRQGFTYLSEKKMRSNKRYSYLNLSLGHEFGLYDWLGVNFDMGLIAQIRKKSYDDGSEENAVYEQHAYFSPLVRFQVFFSL